MADRVHSLVERLEPPAVQPALDRPPLEPACEPSCRSRDHSVLPVGQPAPISRSRPPGVSEFSCHIWSLKLRHALGSPPLWPEFGVLRRVARLAGDGWRHDFFCSRGAQRRHPAQGGGAGCGRGCACRGLGKGALLRDGDRASRALCSGSRSGTGGWTPAQVMVANGSLEAGWMLFEHLLEPGDRVVVEQPTYDRTLLMLQRLGVELVPVALEDDGLDLVALRSGAGGGADQARPHHPQLPQSCWLHSLG